MVKVMKVAEGLVVAEVPHMVPLAVLTYLFFSRSYWLF